MAHDIRQYKGRECGSYEKMRTQIKVGSKALD